MCPRFVFLLTTQGAGWLRLSRREEARKTPEILILRHQLAVLQRRQPGRPKLKRADRALLATLPGVIPKARCGGLRLPVPPDTIQRRHRDITRRRRAARSNRGQTGLPATRRNIKPPRPPAGPRESHRGRQLHPPRPDHPVADLSRERIRRQPVLGGLINEYERAA